MASPGLEPETFSVLDWRDNQLHHDTNVYELQIVLTYFIESVNYIFLITN
jgi:hypothetical protein